MLIVKNSINFYNPKIEKGIFVTKRNYESLLETINKIKNDYRKIQEEMKLNKLPTNTTFIKEMKNLISVLN